MFGIKSIILVVVFGFEIILCCSDHENVSAIPNDNLTTVHVPTRRVMLHNQGSGAFYLAVYADGKVRGETETLRSKNSILEIKNTHKDKIVKITGVESGRYICVNKRKRVKGFKIYRKERCDFEEINFGRNVVYFKSLACFPCYLRIESNGKVGRIISNLPYTIKVLYKYEKFLEENPPDEELQVRINNLTSTTKSIL